MATKTNEVPATSRNPPLSLEPPWIKPRTVWMPEDTASQFGDARAHHCTSATFPSQASSNQSSRTQLPHLYPNSHGARRAYLSKSIPRYASSRPRQNKWLYSHATKFPSHLPPSETRKLCFSWYHTQHCTRQYAFPPAIRCPYRHGLEDVVEIAEPQPWQVQWHNPNCMRPFCPVGMRKKSTYQQICEDGIKIEEGTTYSDVAPESIHRCTSAYQQNTPPHELHDHSASACIDDSIDFNFRAGKRDVATPRSTFDDRGNPPREEKVHHPARSETDGVEPSGPGDALEVTALLETALQQSAVPEKTSQYSISRQLKTENESTFREPFSGQLNDPPWECSSFPNLSKQASTKGVQATIDSLLDLLPQPTHMPSVYKSTNKIEGDITSVGLNKSISGLEQIGTGSLIHEDDFVGWKSLSGENSVRRERIPFPNNSFDYASRRQRFNSDKSEKWDSGHIQQTDTSFWKGLAPSESSPRGGFKERTRPTRSSAKKRKRKGDYWRPGKKEYPEKARPDSYKMGNESPKNRGRISPNSKYPQNSKRARTTVPTIPEEGGDKWLVKRKMYFTQSPGPRNWAPNYPFTFPAEGSTVNRIRFEVKEREGMKDRVTVPQQPSECDNAPNASSESTISGPKPPATELSMKDLCGQGLSFNEAVKVLVKTAQSLSEQRAEKDADFLNFALEEITFEKLPKNS